MALSVMWLDKNKGKITEKEVTKADSNGLEARLRGGTITFIYRFYLVDQDGKRTRPKMTLGQYPKTSLKEARQLRDKYARMVEDGHDPRKKREAEKLTNRAACTLTELYDHWYQVKGNKKVSAKQHYRTYELHMKKKFGGMLYTDISVSSMAEHLIGIARKSPGITDRILADMRSVIDHANIVGLLDNENNMFRQFNRKSLGIVRKRGKRVLSANEIMTFYRVLSESNINEKNAAIIELLLFYGCRGGELRVSEKDWLDFENMQWTVPAWAHKTGHRAGEEVGDDLVRPIIKEVVPLWEKLLKFTDSKYLCTTMKTKIEPGREPMKPSALQSIARTVEEYAINNFVVNDNPFHWDHWSNHDLRRTMRTFCGNFGEWAICERMVAHALPGEADVYDLNQYLEKMETVYRYWWKLLKRLEQQDKVLADLMDAGKWKEVRERIEPEANVVNLKAV